MTNLEKLKAAEDRKQLAEILGFKPSALASIVYLTPLEQKYTVFEIPKKSGGVRTIKAPNPKLKKLQTHLAHLLYGCLAEIDKARDAKPASFGFRKHDSIAANAKQHKRRRYVLNLDLADFFPTFNFGRVRGYFLSNKDFALHEEVATTIAQIACDGAALPQGSPCSPVISELIGQILDIRLLRLAKKYGVRYSRYADDITFSTSQKEFPTALAAPDPDAPAKWTLGTELVGKITQSGFTINDQKTRMHCRGSRQMVTGLVVNEKVNIPSEYYRRARAMCDALFQTGKYYQSHLPPEKEGEPPEPDWKENLNPVEGILSYIYSITGTEDRRPVPDQRKEPRAIRKLYRRFLFYKHFIALKAPLLITEGKTDPIYLREAIKRSPKFHPRLGAPGDGKFDFAVRFFNYHGQAHEIMDLGGGTGDLKSIPLDYLRNLVAKKTARKPFKHKPMKHPVIMVLDNDSGLGSIASVIKENFGVTINLKSTADYYHVIDNLYLIKTPETGGESCIEDLFPKKWKNYKLKGKSFNSASKIDTAKEYSKEVFANSVIVPNAGEIDFAGFDPLLKRIVKVLNHYVPPP
ncbi:retron Ec67 family RNA-directed DNA polymerase/endonuclease [Sphingosinicella sp.]|uniref:retron Ec67 family RNA-directed DNA polymerase/endonuclease n=1 Tax=Sphingosinicella sp. TaxID=1917971 RepID=UPI00261019E5|nr:retron Ec67 family RNA-directed DNA polymerase/endonuclease [Sphingosinicella sp.]